MEISVIFVVLGAAFLHAFWNFQVRGTEDKALGMAAVMFGHIPLAIIGLAFVGLPVSGSCPYVVASAVLQPWVLVGSLQAELELAMICRAFELLPFFTSL